MGYPNATAFANQVKSIVKNVPIEVHDVAHMYDIHGQAPEFIRGKMRRRNARNASFNPIPREISHYIGLHLDVMFACGLAFFLAVARPIGVATIVYLGNAKNPEKFQKSLDANLGTRAKNSLKSALDSILRLFGSYGLYVRRIYSDREKGIIALQDEYPGIPFDPTGAGGHEPVVENRIRTIKGTMRAIRASLPYKLCATLCVWLALYAVYVGNRIPVRGGYMAAPISLVTGRQPDYKTDFPFAFGDEAWVKTNTSTSEQDRATMALALVPNGSPTGAARFMLMKNGAIVTTHNYVIHPHSQDLIDTLNHMHAMHPPPSEDINIRVGTNVVEDGENEDVAAIVANYAPPMRQARDRPEPNPVNIEVQHPGDPTTPENQDTGSQAPNPSPPSPNPEPDPDDDDNDAVPDLHDSDDEDDDNPMPSFSNLGKRAIHQHVNPPEEHPMPSIAPLAATKSIYHQMTLNRALKLKPEPAHNAAITEVMQMYLKEVFEGTLYEDIPPEHRAKIPPSFMFLKDKFDSGGEWERLKARLVLGGNHQIRELYEKHSSPTASVPSIFALSAIAAAEGLDVFTMDIGGAYLNADMGDHLVYMKLDPIVSTMMTEIDPTFSQFIREDGTSIVRLKKALYGSIQAGLLWYKEISSFLYSQGFQSESKNPCLFAKHEEDGKQLISLFVDDLKLVTNQPDRARELYNALVSQYGEVKLHEGQVHDYLGMQFDYSTPGQCTISMRGYIEKLLEDWTDYLHGAEVHTPAANTLFEVRPDTPPLSEADREFFHSTTAMILYLASRVRPDLLLVVSFLTTRVTCADEDDFRKLVRAVRYISETRYLSLILKPDELKEFITFIDASYGPHSDGKSHTGIIQTFGSAFLTARSVKQHIVTKSSAEAELVGLSDLAGDSIAMNELLEFLTLKQGPATIMQDNQATITMATKGKSTSNRSKHISIRYFWLTDRIAQGEVKLQHCPTKDMVADILTKPLQGEQFFRLRAKLLGHEHSVSAR